jgi:hypothetical protein
MRTSAYLLHWNNHIALRQLGQDPEEEKTGKQKLFFVFLTCAGFLQQKRN